MFFDVLRSFFGSRNDRILKKYKPILSKINLIGKDLLSFTDSEIKEHFFFLKKNYIDLDLYNEVLPRVYSIVREVSFRTIGLKHYDVQILGGIALYERKVIEVATGEGKTLIATLPACLYSLFNKSVHIVTVNDYLAKRDAEWMMPIYRFLGIRVGALLSNMSGVERKDAYSSVITYGTCSEFGFDYLRDNIIFNKNDKVQTGLYYAIIDEVDSVLIDEARTPLIISLPDSFDYKIYYSIEKLSEFLVKDLDFLLDEKSKQVHLTEYGFSKLEDLLKKYNLLSGKSGLYDISNINLLHDLYSVLKVRFFFKKDVDYIVKDGMVLIIDEHTGRIMDGRRWSDGIHQALEAKERVKIRSENYTLASITFQNYFRLYESISGMTGTAYTESAEFHSIYGLDVVVIPTNKPCIRLDQQDLVFFDKQLKFKAVISDIKSCYDSGQPILVGTTSIAVSEFISSLLAKECISHNVLNAKNHEKESHIIAEAGKIKSVTIATNMAGRGTDIVLGGKSLTFINDFLEHNNVIKLGGLRVIGTERHESRRIDNQLRGRCGRQGDPGCSQFYLSLEDDLIRIFIGDKIFVLLNKLKMSRTEVISHSLINKSIENAQRRIESYNFDIRKQLLEFDDIFNEQRLVFYKYRNFFVFNDDVIDLIKSLFFDVVDMFFSNLGFSSLNFNMDFSEIVSCFNIEFGAKIVIIKSDDVDFTFVRNRLCEELAALYLSKRNLLDSKIVSYFERVSFLNILDMKWKEHLSNLEYLKKGIHLRGYANQDPKQEYKRESFLLFENMLVSSKYEFIVFFLRFPLDKIVYERISEVSLDDSKLKFNHSESNLSVDKNNVNKSTKIGRNSLCYCNSGKKYKYCHGIN